MEEKKKKPIVSASLSEEEKKMLLDFCEKHDETISRIVRKAIREYLDFHSED